jgi:hypothetical protein
MLRSIGAVAAGYVVFGASAALLFQLSGQEPHEAAPAAFKIATIVWGAVFALVAGWLTARIAVRRPTTHAAILAGLIVLGAAASMAARPGRDLDADGGDRRDGAVRVARRHPRRAHPPVVLTRII